MEVILREHVDNLGRRGEVVKVANGYARNYLLPRKLALAVTEANKQQIERERKAAEARDARREVAGRGLRPAPHRRPRSRSPGASARTTRCTGRSRRPTSRRRCSTKGFEVDKRKIQLPEPLKALGEVTVPVKVHREVIAQVKVKVVAEQALIARDVTDQNSGDRQSDLSIT